MQSAMSTGRALDLGAYWEGQVVDARFQLQQHLGGTPDRAVFLTELDGSKAAIKIVLATSSDPDTQLAAWRRAAELSHPNLIRILAHGRSQIAGKDILYVVSEYADEHLGQVLPLRSLTAGEAETMLMPTLSALSYLHGQGLVHGRLRPANVMAVYDQLKLSSDSVQVAGAARDREEITMYDAPESIGGRVFPPADIWALAVTLAETLSQPASAPTTKEATPYWDLPQPFADIVSNCLQRDPAVRWKPEDISARLRNPAVEKLPPRVDFRQADEPERSRRWSPVIALAGVALLALVAIVYGFLNRGSAPSAESSSPPPTAQLASRQGSDPLPTQGAVRNRVLPNPSESAKNTIHGHIKVRLKVGVDPAGQVSSAKFANPGPSKYFARLAMEAAQQWKFAAPTVNGHPVASEWNLLFEFARGGTDAVPEKVQPASVRN